MSEDDAESWEGYESGPFCRHYGDPCDCDDKCAGCGHKCCEHDQDGRDEGACREPECRCDAWREPEPI